MLEQWQQATGHVLRPERRVELLARRVVALLAAVGSHARTCPHRAVPPDTGLVPGNTETNVRLSYCALEALTASAARWGTSRDATVRQLLAGHVQSQEVLDPDDRRTHISTVLRYPPPPHWRRDPRQDQPPARLRAPAALLGQARALSLELPSQYQRAPATTRAGR